MEFIKKNRSAAALILVVVIVLSVLFGSWRSVSGIANELEREFTKKDKYGETVKGTFDALIMLSMFSFLNMRRYWGLVLK